jgi:3'-phosphoadenosine 5'-phosphosulfate (PAPS) 3'-phosphatase
MQGSANLNLMIKAARKAGRSLVKDFREVENLQVSTKGPGDFVSKADREAERLIKEELLGGRPTYGWLGEETGVQPPGPTRPGAGSSIPWTAPPTSCTACRTGRFPSRWNTRARSSRPWSMTRPRTRCSGPKRVRVPG